MSQPPNGISIGSPVFRSSRTWPIDRQTVRPRYSVCIIRKQLMHTVHATRPKKKPSYSVAHIISLNVRLFLKFLHDETRQQLRNEDIRKRSRHTWNLLLHYTVKHTRGTPMTRSGAVFIASPCTHTDRQWRRVWQGLRSWLTWSQERRRWRSHRTRLLHSWSATRSPSLYQIDTHTHTQTCRHVAASSPTCHCKDFCCHLSKHCPILTNFKQKSY